MTDPTWRSLFDDWLHVWAGALGTDRWAPGVLTQSILPGWSFGPSLTINEENSSSPPTEAAIVQKQSYGRQLGHMAEALEDVVARVGAADDPKVRGFVKMQSEIAEIKARTTRNDIDRARVALEHLERIHPHEYDALLRELTARRRDR